MKKQNHRFRFIVKASLLVLASFVLNLLVAWTCSAWSPLYNRTKLPKHQGGGYPATWTGGPHNEQAWWTTERGFGFVQYTSHSARGAEGDFSYWTGAHIPYREAGWPMQSFRSTVRPYYDPLTHQQARKWDLPIGVILDRGISTDALPAFLEAKQSRRLAIVPIWNGLLINVLFYLLLIILPATWLIKCLKKRILGPNACHGCGYDLTGNETGECPECGVGCDEKGGQVS